MDDVELGEDVALCLPDRLEERLERDRPVDEQPGSVATREREPGQRLERELVAVAVRHNGTA